MQKAFLMSILLATMVIAMRNARLEDARLGLQKTVRQMAIYIVLWTLGCTYLYWYLPS